MAAREDTMICMDNSEWMRNGDYSPSRLEAQYNAIEKLLSLKKRNAENTVGLLSLAGGSSIGVQVLCSPTNETFKVGRAAQSVKIGGKSDLVTGLRVAHLALKHRANTAVQARIIVFVGSPLGHVNKESLLKFGKILRKNKVAVDVISLGEIQENEQLLNEFSQSVKKTNGPECTLLVAQPGTFLEDLVGSSPLAGDGAFAEEEMDPILRAVMEASLQEHQQSQGGGAPPMPAPKSTGRSDNVSVTATTGGVEPNAGVMEIDDEDDDAILEQAKLLSLLEESGDQQGTTANDTGNVLSESHIQDVVRGTGVDPDDEELKKEVEELKKAAKKKKDEEK